MLPACDAHRLFKGGLALVDFVEPGQHDAFEAMKLWLPPALPRSFLLLQPLSHRRESRLALPLSRRGFARLAASAAVLSPIAGRAIAASPLDPAPAPGRDPWLGLKMGIATYTFSKLPTEKAIERGFSGCSGDLDGSVRVLSKTELFETAKLNAWRYSLLMLADFRLEWGQERR